MNFRKITGIMIRFSYGRVVRIGRRRISEPRSLKIMAIISGGVILSGISERIISADKRVSNCKLRPV